MKRSNITKRNSVFTVIYYVAVCILSFVCAVSFFIPSETEVVFGTEGQYRCVWENGAESAESYASVCRDLFSVGENGDVVLHRDGKEGRIASRYLQNAQNVLKTAPLAALLSFDFSPLNAVERAALAHDFADVVYYSEGDAFRYTQNGVERVEKVRAKTLALVTSSLPVSLVRNAGAREVWIYPETVIKPQMFVGSEAEKIVAQEPYFVQDGVLYLKTVSGVRCVAALPNLKKVVLGGNDFSDEGALLPCKTLEELTVPFAGNDKNTNGTLYRGEIGHLFSEGNGYEIPRSLKKITVTGGKLVSHAFYACRYVEEINACGVDWRNVDRFAFVDCRNLKILHTSRRSLELPEGEFYRETAPCGCYVYTRCEGE